MAGKYSFYAMKLGDSLVRRLFEHLVAQEIPELSGRKISISVGAALCSGDKTASFDDLYAKVDSAMYISKKSSGNVLTFAGS